MLAALASKGPERLLAFLNQLLLDMAGTEAERGGKVSLPRVAVAMGSSI
jgi:hypothetical protein